MNDLTPLIEAARRFREAILRCPPKSLGITFESFPRGACGDTSDLLCEYLIDIGFQNVKYVSGERWDPDYHSHAWVEVDGVIVDITADQFPDVSEPVLVTRDSTWHRQFETVTRKHRGHLQSDVQTEQTLSRAFRTIKAQLG